MHKIKLVVFDMSGTTVKDNNEVLDCFFEAAQRTGIRTTPERINTMMGWSKIEVFRTLWRDQEGQENSEVKYKVLESFQLFRELLENYYRTNPVEPTQGTPEMFQWLISKGVKTALTTGFYREVADILLQRLGWMEDLDEHYLGNGRSLINLSLTSDQVQHGRPAPDMILKAMKTLGISDPKQVVNIGDTPSDLQSGKAAGCLLSIGMTSGTHSAEELGQHPNDGLLASMQEFRELLEPLI